MTTVIDPITTGPADQPGAPPAPPVPPRRGRAGLPSAATGLVFVVVAIVVGELLAAGSGKGAVPFAFMVDGLVQGLVASLFAAGLLLVYKSSRIISFAHGSISLATAVIAFTLMGERWSWWAVAPLAIAAGVVAGIAVEVALLRRFTTSPRLVATVATIAAGQVLVSAVYALPQWRFDVDLFGGKLTSDDLARLPTQQLHSPFNSWYHHATKVVVFSGDHLVALVGSIAALAGLGAFLRWSRAGIAIRGIAENAERAALLGVGTGTMGTVVWAIAGGLAALGAVLGEPLRHTNLTSVAVGGGATAAAALLQGLTAVVLGRMTDLTRTIAASIAISLFGRCVFWATGRTGLEDVALLLVIAVALLAQRTRLSRIDESSASGWAAAEEIRPVPPVLRPLPAVQTGRRWAIAIFALIVIGYPFAMSPSQVFLGATYAIYGIVAVSLVILAGWGGQISLGQFGLVAVGASVGGSLTANAHVPFPIAALLACLAGAAVAILLGLPALRIRGLYLAVTTLAFAVAMSSFVLDPHRFGYLVPQKVGRPHLGFIDFSDDRAFYFLAVAGLGLAVAMALALRRTRTGRVLIAMRDNERAAQSFGISLARTRLATFALSGFIAAWAGVLLVAQTKGLHPESFVPEQSIQMFLMAVIGGLGSVSGVLAGALYLGTAGIVIKGTFGQLMASGIGVVLVLIAYPSGLGGLVYSARDAWLRRIALREKIFVRSLLGDVRDLTSERSRAPLTPKTAPDQRYELESDVRRAGDSQRAKGWVYG